MTAFDSDDGLSSLRRIKIYCFYEMMVIIDGINSYVLNVLWKHKLKLQFFVGTWLLFGFGLPVKSRNLELLAREKS